MMKKLLLPIVAVVVLSIATPSFATFWKGDSKDWNFDWSKLQDREWDNDWDWDWDRDIDREWPDRGDIKEWLEGKDWTRDGHDWGSCGNDNPVPEPATAGLAFMGLGALIVATCRRK